MPARSLQCIARLFPVMRQERGALVQLRGVDLGDRPCHRRVRSRSALSQLRAIGYFLRQRMLEGVLRLRVERLFVNELGSSELAERFRKFSLGQFRYALQHWLGKVPSDNGRCLKEMLLAALQSIDSRGEYSLN